MRFFSMCMAAICASSASADTNADPIHAVVENVVGEDTPGLAVLVTRDGEVLHMAGYGYANIETEEPVTPASIFDLASVSKQMTAMVSLLQMNDEIYTAETEIWTVLPDFSDDKTAERPIAVLDLIHHLSGLPDYLSGDLDFDAKTSNREVVEWLSTAERDHDVATEFDYSNSGYLTLGTVVATVEGQGSLEAVLEQRIWSPLEMTSTSLVSPVDAKRAVTGYAGLSGNFEKVIEPTISEGDGNVFSTLEDLGKYEAWLSENGMLPQMHPVFRNGSLDDGTPIDDGAGAGYGFGWFLEEMSGSDYAYHSGSWTGTSTYYQRNLSTGVSVILLANGEDIDLDGLALDIEAFFDSDHPSSTGDL